MVVQNLLKEKRSFKASDVFIDEAHVKDKSLFNLAQKDYLAYWQQQAEQLHWATPFKEILKWEPPYASWFMGGELNLSYNCIDRHMPTLKDKVAFYWEGERGNKRVITYGQLYEQVQKCANSLKKLGITKGDRVALYMPMSP